MSFVQFHAKARSELRAIRDYYDHQRSGLGDEFIVEVGVSVDLIAKQPERFSRYRKTNVRLCLVNRFPYGLVYISTARTVWIVAVGHHRRRPGYWKSRLKDIE